jgi:putative peptide maturation dehydrogenase
MRLRRRRCCFIQIADHRLPSFPDLFAGKLVFHDIVRADLLCPLRGERIALDGRSLALIAALSAREWTAAAELVAAGTATVEELQALAARGAVVSDGEDEAARALRQGEERLERIGWHDLAAVYHAFTRWHGIEGDEGRREHTEAAHRARLDEQVAAFGAAPTHHPVRADAIAHRDLSLPDTDDAFTRLRRRRPTARAFDTQRWLELAALERLLYLCFGVQGKREFAPGLVALRKTSASGGGLHPIDPYLVAIRVDGLESGIYHYDGYAHRLELLERASEDVLRQWIAASTIGQVYFAEAHACVVHVARFERNYWKYRQHAKAYKAVLMDSAHLSQTFYLAATELGLGAYYTAAINDGDIGARLRLDDLREGAVAISGVGLAVTAQDGLHFDALPHDPRHP